MLTLSSKTVYSVVALLELALNYGKRARKIREISKSQKIPEDYLRQILITLKKAGFVASERGNNGGYQLALSPNSITVREIVKALDGPVELTAIKSREKVLNLYWKDCGVELENYLNVSLEELISRKRELDETFEFQI